MGELELVIMPIRMLLKDDHWFGPEDIAGLTEALEGALSKLGVVNRDDPTTLTVAKLIIHLAKEGERDPAQLRDHAVEISQNRGSGLTDGGSDRLAYRSRRDEV